MKGSLANFIFEAKSMSKQDVLIMVICPSNVCNKPKAHFQVGYFSLYSLNRVSYCRLTVLCLNGLLAHSTVYHSI